ncbi:MAG: DedA family protein, partial [Candidatus Promineifilaceae bacterium]
MNLILSLVDFVLHLDAHLAEMVLQYGFWVYGILFLIIFVETGLVLMPFLPGDSLLFAAGALAATGSLKLPLLLVLLGVAAILGDTVNYWIGHQAGQRAFDGRIRFLKKSHLDRTHEFFNKHGGKAVILARFVPIVRTFAPFVAGAGAMNYRRFVIFNITGGVAWTLLLTFAGFFFGNLPFVRENFSLVVLVVVAISL